MTNKQFVILIYCPFIHNYSKLSQTKLSWFFYGIDFISVISSSLLKPR